jgi:hypothetical protein
MTKASRYGKPRRFVLLRFSKAGQSLSIDARVPLWARSTDATVISVHDPSAWVRYSSSHRLKTHIELGQVGYWGRAVQRTSSGRE